jgi:hypothetical protein
MKDFVFQSLENQIFIMKALSRLLYESGTFAAADMASCLHKKIEETESVIRCSAMGAIDNFNYQKEFDDGKYR